MGHGQWELILCAFTFVFVFMQDVAALESQPLLGFLLKVDSSEKLQFKLYHKNTLHYMFKADDEQTAQRYDTDGADLMMRLLTTTRKITSVCVLPWQVDRLVQRINGAVASNVFYLNAPGDTILLHRLQIDSLLLKCHLTSLLHSFVRMLFSYCNTFPNALFSALVVNMMPQWCDASRLVTLVT